MANPTPVVCTKDTWTIVATNVTSGFIWIKNYRAKYAVDYRMNGDPAPTDQTTSVPMPQPGYMINNPDAGIDVYVYAEDAAGLVVAALP